MTTVGQSRSPRTGSGPAGRAQTPFVRTRRSSRELVIVHHGTPGSGEPLRGGPRTPPHGGFASSGYDRPDTEGRTGRRDAGRRGGRDVAAIADAFGVERFRTYGGSGGGPHALTCVPHSFPTG
jgi:pimeloyl-ACP methyl ester carboxylesterase